MKKYIVCCVEAFFPTVGVYDTLEVPGIMKEETTAFFFVKFWRRNDR